MDSNQFREAAHAAIEESLYTSQPTLLPPHWSSHDAY